MATIASAVPSQVWLGSVITSMTRQRHHAMINIASVAPSPTRLSSAITSMNRQWHHRMTNVILAASSPSLAWLGSTIANMIWQRHHATTIVDSAATMPAWLDCDIMSRPTSTWQHDRQHDLAATSRHGQHRLGSAIASMTRQWHHATSNISSAAPSPAEIGSLKSTTPTDGPTRVPCYQHRRF
jgi:hypothetical protein